MLLAGFCNDVNNPEIKTLAHLFALELKQTYFESYRNPQELSDYTFSQKGKKVAVYYWFGWGP